MKIENIEEAVAEAKRFIKKANAHLDRAKKDKYYYLVGTKESGACKRASLDLTRALSKMRQDV